MARPPILHPITDVLEASEWVRLRPDCHPDAGWRIKLSLSMYRMAVNCATCDRQVYVVNLRPRREA